MNGGGIIRFRLGSGSGRGCPWMIVAMSWSWHFVFEGIKDILQEELTVGFRIHMTAEIDELFTVEDEPSLSPGTALGATFHKIAR
jgi:hypothetical protein